MQGPIIVYHYKKRVTNFSQPLQRILCEGRLAKILNFFFKNLSPSGEKKRQNYTKKISKKYLLEQIL